MVLVDALGALAAGPRALGDLTAAMAATLACFRHGENSWLDRVLGGRRIDKLLFVASKADHLHHEQHPRADAAGRGDAGRGGAPGAVSRRRDGRHGDRRRARQLGADDPAHDGPEIGVVRGRRASDGKEVALFPGRLPEDVPALLAQAARGHSRARRRRSGTRAPTSRGRSSRRRAGRAGGQDGSDGPPHIRLDRAIEFLIGDRLE